MVVVPSQPFPSRVVPLFDRIFWHFAHPTTTRAVFFIAISRASLYKQVIQLVQEKTDRAYGSESSRMNFTNPYVTILGVWFPWLTTDQTRTGPSFSSPTANRPCWT